jgi:hypothetical protein
LTYSEKVTQTREDRSLSINQKVSTQLAKIEAIDKDDFNNSYLWGDGINIGIQQLIKYYYIEKNKEVGRTFSSPSLSNYTEINWEAILKNAITVGGDGSSGFYPDLDSNGIADKNMNMGTPYLNDNGDNGETSEGLLLDIVILDGDIGQDATTTGTYTGPGGFPIQSTAQTEAEEYLYGADLTEDTSDDNLDRIGATLRGRRTRDVEIVITGMGPYNYEIGDGNIDEPTFFADTADVNGYGGNEKTTFLNSLSTFITNLEDYRDNALIPLRDELDNIFDSGVNTLFTDTDMINDVTDDSANLDTLISLLNTYIGVNTDVATDGSLYGYQSFFSSALGDEVNFDTYLTELETLNNNIDTDITNRTNNLINTYVGDTYQDKMKKWRTFWIKERINKPQASLISVEGADKAISDAIKSIENVNDTLKTLFSDTDLDRQQWIPTPKIYSAFYNPIIDNETGEILIRRVGLIYGGQQHATKYEVYRDLLENITLSNDEWSSSLIIKEITGLNSQGTVKLQYEDFDVELDKSYVYRVRVYDDTNDSGYAFSGSLQSKIYDDDNTISYSFQETEQIIFDGNQIEASKIDITKDNNFSLGARAILLSSSGYNDNIYTIAKLKENIDDVSIWVYPALQTEEDGNIYYFTNLAIVSQ